MNDETERFTPPRPAIPVARTKQEERVADAEHEATLTRLTQEQVADIEHRKKVAVGRFMRAKKAWQTRRANATVKHTPPPDRHRPAVFTAKEAVELARLMVDYPFLRKLVE